MGRLSVVAKEPATGPNKQFFKDLNQMILVVLLLGAHPHLRVRREVVHEARRQFVQVREGGGHFTLQLTHVVPTSGSSVSSFKYTGKDWIHPYSERRRAPASASHL